MLAGCANGDFQEVRPSLVNDNIHNWLASDAVGSVSTSHFQLTDDERLLRDLAFPLIQPPYDRQQWYSVAGEYGLLGSGPYDRAAYWHRLEILCRRSPASAYAQLTDDVRNDTTRLPGFFETATRVLDIDQKRRRSMAIIGDLSKPERVNAVRRMRENAAIVALTRARLLQRVASYHFALERLVVQTPSPKAVEVEQAINELRALLARYRAPAPTWERQPSLAAQN